MSDFIHVCRLIQRVDALEEKAKENANTDNEWKEEVDSEIVDQQRQITRTEMRLNQLELAFAESNKIDDDNVYGISEWHEHFYERLEKLETQMSHVIGYMTEPQHICRDGDLDLLRNKVNEISSKMQHPDDAYFSILRVEKAIADNHALVIKRIEALAAMMHSDLMALGRHMAVGNGK